ncbi:MAG: glycosyltransferase family 2 protein [Bryobacteraceae bacterium]|jgi:hypothetical protein
MTLLVRDEQDVIAANIAYHLSRGVDHIIVTDNGSVDATREIVKDFARAGKVTLIDEAGDDYSQYVWVTRMARAAAKMGADWVINNDADEMWWPLEGNLKTALERVPRKCGSAIVERSNMLPVRGLDGHPFERMVLRDVHSVGALGSPLSGKAAHRAKKDVEVMMGNHGVSSPSLGPSMETRAMTIFHFRYRSYAQFERKIANGGAAMLRNRVLPQEICSRWRELYKRLQAGTLKAWYDALPHVGDPEVKERVARGEIVEDERLARYLRETVFGNQAPGGGT